MSLLASAPLVLGSALAALVLLAWAWQLERSRPRAGWRRWALVVMAACLFLLAARPARQRPVVSGSAILLTAGSDPDEVAALDSAAALLALPGAPPEIGEQVADLAAAVRRRPELRRWLVTGTGLDPWQLAALPGEVSYAAPSAPRDGIDRAQWRRRVGLGESLEVRGSVLIGEEIPATLSLVGPAGVEARRELVGSSTFILNATPRQEGRFLYRLELEGASGALATEMVDVEVTAPRLPRLLWLEGAPGFESRKVKTWLRDLGGALILRTQISRGRSRYDYLNQERIEVARLSPGTLAGFDLLVVDGSAWSGLASAERAAVEEAVGAGLGLLLVPTLPRLAGGAAPPAPFDLEAVADLDALEVEAAGPGVPPLPPLTIEARQFSARPGQRTLLADSAGRALAVSRPRGLGQVAATILEGTYRWSLRGESASHRRYWSHLLAGVARRSMAANASLPAGPLLLDRPITVDLFAEEAELMTVIGPGGDEIRLAVTQDPLEPRHWQATVWPRGTGWHRLVWGQESSAFYVGGSTEWTSWQEREAYLATRLRSALGGEADRAAELDQVLRPLPRWPLFALLLVTWALLWVDEQWRAVPAEA